MTSRHTAAASAVLFALSLAVPRASAQTPDREGLAGLGIRVSALGGPASALTDLGTTQPDQSQAFRSDLEPGWAVGGAVEVPLTRAFSVRGDARFAPGSEMLTQSLTCPVGGLTSEPEHCAARSDGSYWTATGGIVYRTEMRPGMPQAFFHAGGGVKRYDFSTEPAMEGLGGDVVYTGECPTGDRVCEVHVRRGFAGEHTDVTGRFGFGLSMGVGGVLLSGELADYVSIFAPANRPGDRTIQHDLFLVLEVAREL